jgi:serine/threonine protein kinase
MQITERFGKLAKVDCDRVRLLEPIGQGTFGYVYKGELMKQDSGYSATAADASIRRDSSSSGRGSCSSSLGQYVAVKVLPACLQPPAQIGCKCGPCKCFRNERNGLVLLQKKDGVVQLLAVGAVTLLGPAAAADPGCSSSSSSAQQQVQEQLVRRPCMVMELADGNLESSKRHDDKEASELMFPVLAGLTSMHSGTLGLQSNHKVVHRDLKPANILLTAAGPVICDFSSCAVWRFPARGCQMMHTIAGTPMYMPVEMRDPGKEGYSSDCDSYSIGLVALSLLLGGSAAVDQRGKTHSLGTVDSWLVDFVNAREVPREQNISKQARDFVRCCCLKRQRPMKLMQHKWLREACNAAHALRLGAAER